MKGRPVKTDPILRVPVEVCPESKRRGFEDTVFFLSMSTGTGWHGPGGLGGLLVPGSTNDGQFYYCD